MAIVIGVCGQIASGKTTVAKIISQEYNFHFTSFGDYVRSKAQEMQLTISRQVLQNLGQSLLETDINSFCRHVVFQNQWDSKSNLVIDGVRHVSVIHELEKILFPLKFKLLFIDTSSSIRNDRLKENERSNIDSHITEIDVKSKLKNMATYKIDGGLSLADIESEIKQFMLHLGSVT